MFKQQFFKWSFFLLVITISVSLEHKKERHPILFMVYIIFSTYVTSKNYFDRYSKLIQFYLANRVFIGKLEKVLIYFCV